MLLSRVPLGPLPWLTDSTPGRPGLFAGLIAPNEADIVKSLMRVLRLATWQLICGAGPLVGVGALSWITLQLEIRGWERFQNRRQIASYTGRY